MPVRSLVVAASIYTVSTVTVALAQEVDLSVTVDDGVDSQVLDFGLDPAATDGIDAGLGESEQPPLPPAGNFDARFIDTDLSRTGLGEGTLLDYLNGSSSCQCSREHELQFQEGSGSEITVSWDWPAGVDGVLNDVITGDIVDVVMTGNGNTTVPNGINRLTMTVNYGNLPVELANFSGVASLGTVILRWTTLSETENSGFEVQMSPTGAAAFETAAFEATAFETAAFETAAFETAAFETAAFETAAFETAAFETVAFVPGAGTSVLPNDYSYTVSNLAPGSFSFRLKQIDFSGAASYSHIVDVSVGPSYRYGLEEAFPNPFSSSTDIGLFLSERSEIRLTVYDILGRLVETVAEGTFESGHHLFRFESAGHTSGTYLLRLSSDYFVETKTMTLVK